MKLHDKIMPYGILNSNYKKHLSVSRNIKSVVRSIFKLEENFNAKFHQKIFFRPSITVKHNALLSFIMFS